jgi:drug/metabolite transporter (DMT)-like permease
VWAGRIVASVALLPLVWMLPERKGQIESAFLVAVVLIVQSALDIGGYLLLFAGSRGSQPHIVAVIASSFGAVTTLLGYFIVRERVSTLQWSGIALVFAGVMVLSLAPHG